jgi:hypothetical protein
MNTYVFNPTKAPQIFGQRTFPPENYEVVDESTRDILKTSGVPIIAEGDTEFRPLWAVNIPESTPDKVA